MFVTVAGKFKPSELERRRLDKLLVEIEEKWAAHQTPADNPGLRRFKDPGQATRHADRAAKRSDTPQYVYALSSNPEFAVLPEGHPVQHGIEQGSLDMGAARLIHTAIPPLPSPNPRKRRKKKAKSTREDRRARLRRLLRL